MLTGSIDVPDLHNELVLLRKGGLLRIHLGEFRVSFITFGIIGKITKQITILANKDYSDLIFCS